MKKNLLISIFLLFTASLTGMHSKKARIVKAPQAESLLCLSAHAFARQVVIEHPTVSGLLSFLDDLYIELPLALFFSIIDGFLKTHSPTTYPHFSLHVILAEWLIQHATGKAGPNEKLGLFEQLCKSEKTESKDQTDRLLAQKALAILEAMVQSENYADKLGLRPIYYCLLHTCPTVLEYLITRHCDLLEILRVTEQLVCTNKTVIPFITILKKFRKDTLFPLAFSPSRLYPFNDFYRYPYYIIGGSAIAPNPSLHDLLQAPLHYQAYKAEIEGSSNQRDKIILAIIEGNEERIRSLRFP